MNNFIVRSIRPHAERRAMDLISNYASRAVMSTVVYELRDVSEGRRTVAR